MKLGDLPGHRFPIDKCNNNMSCIRHEGSHPKRKQEKRNKRKEIEFRLIAMQLLVYERPIQNYHKLRIYPSFVVFQLRFLIFLN